MREAVGLADKLGRRRLVMLIAIVFIIGALILAASTNLALLIIGRLIIGLAVGGSMSTVPVYLSEMAPTEYRGSLGSLNQLMITIGILAAYLVNYAFADIEGWRWMLGLAVVPSVVYLWVFILCLRVQDGYLKIETKKPLVK